MVSNSKQRDSDIEPEYEVSTFIISIIVAIIIVSIILYFFHEKAITIISILLFIGGVLLTYWLIGTIVFYKKTKLKFEAMRNFFFSFFYIVGALPCIFLFLTTPSLEQIVSGLKIYLLCLVIPVFFIHSLKPFIRKERRENQEKWERLYQMSFLDFLLLRFPEVRDLKEEQKEKVVEERQKNSHLEL